MRFHLHNASLKIKFVILAVVISIISVVTCMVILGVSNVQQQKANTEAIVLTDVHQIAEEFAIRAVHKDTGKAQIDLKKLHTRLSYRTIAIYDVEQNLISYFSEEDTINLSELSSSEDEFTYKGGFLNVHAPLYHHNELIGYTFLQLDTNVCSLIKKLLVPILFVMLAAVLIALLIAMRFRRYITQPVLDLAKTVSRISAQNDFSIKIERSSDDEIGVLYDNFNFMLETIRHHEKKRDTAERAYQISEENFMNIFHNSYDGILLTDMDGGFLEVNDTLCNYLGYTRANFKEKGVLAFVSDDYLERRQKIMDDLRYNGYSSHDMTYIANNGERVPFEVNSRLIFYEDQHGILSILRDVRERKQAEEKLLHEANVNKAIAQISREIINPDLSLENISHTVDLLAQKLTNSKLGYTSYFDPLTEEQVVSTTDKMIDWDNSGHSIIRFPKIDKGYTCLYRVECDHSKAYFNNNPIADQKTNNQSVCKTTITNFLSVPAISGNNIVGQIVVANIDGGYTNEDQEIISRIASIYSVAVHQKLTNEDLKREMRRAEESDRLKSAFLANMSHEIRTPMNGILGFTNLLRNDELPSKSRDKYLNIISSSSERLLNILNDIIDISKIESGVINLDNSQFSLNLLLDEVYTFFIPAADKKNIKLKLKRHSGTDIILNTDKQKVSQILTNLVSNAIKFTLKGSVEISYTFDEKVRKVTIQVHDTGIGIDAEYENKIFQRFRQVETSVTRQFGGNGLGLSISKAFADAMDGTLSFESKEGAGTTFTFSLSYQFYGKALAGEAELKDEISQLNFNGKCILVVEDDEYNYEYLHNFLESVGVKLMWAKNGLEGLEKVKEFADQINLILMDIKLPIMDGYTATKEIKELHPDIPVIAQTAYGFTDDKQKALDSKCDDYLAKPLTVKQLVDMLKKYLM